MLAAPPVSPDRTACHRSRDDALCVRLLGVQVPRDDFGQVGEIRPMKPKPMALTVGIIATMWFSGFRQTKRLIAAAAVAPWVPELVLRTTLISGYLILASLFIKAHDIFEYPLGVPLPPPERR